MLGRIALEHSDSLSIATFAECSRKVLDLLILARRISVYAVA